MNDLLAQLRQSPEFKIIMAEMVKSRPVIPRYAVQETVGDGTLLLEKIKFETARQDGFDLLFGKLAGVSPADMPR